jgi:predicted metal-dependent hydrolase
LKVTHPRAVGSSAALAWAASQKDWVVEQLDRVLPAAPFVPGAIVPLDGEEIELCWSEYCPRVPRLIAGKLICGGPPESFARRVELFLRRLALDRLSEETAALARAAGLRAISISVGDPRTRWGSCSSSGRIRYSWRLILADPEARRYVVAHEVAHLRHLDHGSGFKALVSELFGGDVAAAEALLRSAGPRLRRIGLRD